MELLSIGCFNNQHQYCLTDEQGPAHMTTVFVKLKLGEEEFAASGASVTSQRILGVTCLYCAFWPQGKHCDFYMPFTCHAMCLDESSLYACHRLSSTGLCTTNMQLSKLLTWHQHENGENAVYDDIVKWKMSNLMLWTFQFKLYVCTDGEWQIWNHKFQILWWTV
jgi:hypothetical protein